MNAAIRSEGVGVVAIGRNEGNRLGRCLRSLVPDGVTLVYVDSGSTDASVDLARSLGVEVVELDPSRPFSAGRARNEGFDRCLRLHPDTRYVMFVDGDCEVEPGWLARAAQELAEHPELAAVCGRRRELHPEQSVYNRLADLEWDTPIGLTDSCGGDAMFRVADFKAVDGFDPSAKAGEEPELCRRLRLRGRRIARIDAAMTRHDLAMTRFAEWWRRQFRVGYHGMDVETRLIGDGSGPFAAGLRRARVWGIGWQVVVLTAALILGWIWGPVMAAAGVVAGFGLLAAQAARLAWRIRRRVCRPGDAVVFGVLGVAEKWANLAGQAQYVRDRNRGRAAGLIEYKRPVAERVG